MESFGAHLKSLREEKGKSLEDLAASTKIAVSNLDFLEKDRYDLLPPRVFVKGFIRSYVQELGLNPEETVRRFEAFTKEGEFPDYSDEEHPVFYQKPSTGTFISGTWFTVALTALGVVSLSILILAGVTRVFFSDDSGKVTQPRVSTAQPRGFTESSARIESDQNHEESAFSQPAPGQTGKKVLEIKAVANTWVRVEPDNGPAEELVMAPGDIQIFTAKHGFSVQTGNAGGIKVRFDGRELPALGKSHQALSLTLP
jgi:cytoskeletal protein RodZ